MVLIVLTGFFGSGKTTVSKAFQSLGAYVLDSDKIVAGLYRKKSVQKRLAKEFGSGIVVRGKVNRHLLAEKVFSNKQELKKLNRLVHPLVFSEIRKKEKKLSKKQIVVVDVPLFFESRARNKIVPDFVVLAFASRKKILERLRKKGFSKRDILVRMKAQLPPSKKKKLSDFVIDNSKSVEHTRMQVKKIFEQLSGWK